MDNSVNNNVNNLGTTNVVTPTNATTTNTTMVNSASTATPVANTATVVNPNVTTTIQTANTTQKNNSNFYLIVGFFVGFVLLAAIFLLVLLLTGVIGNRNRLTCTKTVNEDGYTHVTQKFYKFDGNVYTQVNNVDTYTYTNLTDDVYNQTFEKIINNESNGVTSFGFGTQISREGNVVKITSYNPNFFGKTYDDVKGEDEGNGFTCE